MKLTIERTTLLKALTHVQSAANDKSTVSIYAHILVEAHAGKLWLTATNSNITIVDNVPVDIEIPGEISVPGKLLYNIVRKLPEGKPITLHAENSQIIVKAGRSRFKLPTLPREDFPSQEDISFSNEFQMAAVDLCNIIDNTNFTVSTEETRYYLRGLFLHTTTAAGADVLRAAATDGHRLARYTVAQPEGAQGMPSIIVPGDAVTELRKLITNDGDDITVAVSENQIRFVVGATTLTSKLISGTFPSYERVIPKDNDKDVLVNCGEFSKALDRASLVLAEKTRVVKLTITDGLLTISARGPNGDADEEVEVDYKGPSIEVGFNARYLLDITSIVNGDVKLEIGDTQAPMILNDTDNDAALYIVMPMRV